MLSETRRHPRRERRASILADRSSASQPFVITAQTTSDRIPTFWVASGTWRTTSSSYLRHGTERPVSHALRPDRDRRASARPSPGPAASDFTVVYHLLSYDAERRMSASRWRSPDSALELPTVTDIWPAANWYECEVWDMFGITFDGHPHLRRILMPPTWTGPSAAQGPSRAGDGDGPLRAHRGTRGWPSRRRCASGPSNGACSGAARPTISCSSTSAPTIPSVHGVFRIVLQLDGEEIVDAVPDIGYHHRGAEKMGERQSWHTYIPYTDRIDYLGGVMNNLPYVLAVEKLAGIEVPDRVKVIRVMLAELFRIISHLGVLRHHGSGCRRDVAGVLHVHRPRARLRDHRGDLRLPHASELVPHRRRGAGPAPGLGPPGPGISRLSCRRGSTSTTSSS